MIVQLTANGIIAGCTYAIVAIGFTVIYGTVRFFHFAHGVVFAASAYAAWACVTHLHLPLPLAAIVAVVAGGVLGVLIDRCVYRSLRERRSPNLILLLASFGVFLLIQNSLQLIFGSDIKVLRDGPVTEGYRVLGATITGTQIGIIISSVVLAGATVLLMRRTSFGKAIRAVADDPLAASLVGINSQRTISYAFFVGSALAGAAGVLVALETNVHPTMGLNAAIKGIIAALIGGMGSIPGALLGGLLIGLAENVGVGGISSGWKDAIAFAILVVFLLFRPGGIFSADLAVRKV
ncbi:MAG: branched-chain amino acid ABC transporter permease [Phycisphaerae bacterium]|jgi:branched-chain amino acid transport system permease protein